MERREERGRKSVLPAFFTVYPKKFISSAEIHTCSDWFHGISSDISCGAKPTMLQMLINALLEQLEGILGAWTDEFHNTEGENNIQSPQITFHNDNPSGAKIHFMDSLNSIQYLLLEFHFQGPGPGCKKTEISTLIEAGSESFLICPTNHSPKCPRMKHSVQEIQYG